MRSYWGKRLGATVAAILVVAACGDDGTGDDGDAVPIVDDGGDAAAGADAGAGSTGDVFPDAEWPTADPEAMGFDGDVLDVLADDAAAHDSYCLVVTKDGHLVGEWYWTDDEDPDERHEAFSVTKSYTSTLVGIAADEGLLDLDDRVADYIDEWAGTPSEDITIRNLISNDSGRNWGFGDYVPIVAAPDANRYALDLGQGPEPGTEWVYNDGAIQVLDLILAEVTGGVTADYAREKLLDPIGAASSELGRDREGNTYLFFNLQTTCRDMARYGYLFLRDGNWDGEQMLPEGWVEEATMPSQDLNAGYGYLWWLNRSGDRVSATGETVAEDTGEADDGQALPDAPEDMFWASGLGGQTILVDPGSGVVATRLGTENLASGYGAADLARVVTEALD